MEVNKKAIIGAAIVVIIIAVGLVTQGSQTFQGRLSVKDNLDTSRIFSFYENIVSVVTSPVTSVVVSEVTSEVLSEVGTSLVASQVTSEVPSAVTSPVASGVTITNPRVLDQIDINKLKELTEQLLNDIAWSDYKKDPKRFTLSAKEQEQIIEMYNK